MRSSLLAAFLALASCATAPSGARCAVSTEDRVWIEASLDAWRFSASEITGITTYALSRLYSSMTIACSRARMHSAPIVSRK